MDGLGKAIKKKIRIDEEFQQNKDRQEKNDKISFMDGKDLLNFGKHNPMPTRKI